MFTSNWISKKRKQKNKKKPRSGSFTDPPGLFLWGPESAIRTGEAAVFVGSVKASGLVLPAAIRTLIKDLPVQLARIINRHRCYGLICGVRRSFLRPGTSIPVADPLAVSVIGIGSSAAVLPGAVAAFIDVVGTVAFGAVEGEWLGGIWQSELM